MKKILIITGILFLGCNTYVPQFRSSLCKDITKPCILQCNPSFGGGNPFRYDYYAPTTIWWNSGKINTFEFYDLDRNITDKVSHIHFELHQYRCYRVQIPISEKPRGK